MVEDVELDDIVDIVHLVGVVIISAGGKVASESTTEEY